MTPEPQCTTRWSGRGAGEQVQVLPPQGVAGLEAQSVPRFSENGRFTVPGILPARSKGSTSPRQRSRERTSSTLQERSFTRRSTASRSAVGRSQLDHGRGAGRDRPRARPGSRRARGRAPPGSRRPAPRPARWPNARGIHQSRQAALPPPDASSAPDRRLGANPPRAELGRPRPGRGQRVASPPRAGSAPGAVAALSCGLEVRVESALEVARGVDLRAGRACSRRTGVVEATQGVDGDQRTEVRGRSLAAPAA